ncbi:MAG TPA: GDCCVxC domain-containing (seleno)protein [Thermomicrobiales bacterium]|nr:GDCCVxC domain-containing (seleno)protein [Thermomicrobiales bacterium]
MAELVTISRLVCPQCRKTTVATMPLDTCQFFFTCPHCAAVIRPKPGDCCVFCSYGDVPCPPVQQGGDCCTIPNPCSA